MFWAAKVQKFCELMVMNSQLFFDISQNAISYQKMNANNS